MDPLSLLRNKVATLSSSRAYTGLLAAIKHFDIASGHLERGRSGADAYLFTDALLRIDRAFDAVVAELHSLIFTDEAPPNRTEASASRLIDSGALSKRAGELLASHLSSWRSLVDNDLQFAASEQDAYLAYLQAAALFGVLFDEIVQRQAYQSEKEKSEQRLETLGSAAGPQHPERSPNGTTLRHSLIQLLEAFARTLPEASNGAPAAPTEGQLMGRLRGFLETVLPASSLLVDPPLRSPSGVLRPSFIVARGDESVVLEVRREAEGREPSNRSFVTEKMMMYLLTSGVGCGVIAYLPDSAGELEVQEASFRLDGRNHATFTLEERQPGQ